MVNFCSVVGCRNSSKNAGMHSFPMNNKPMLDIWIKKIGRKKDFKVNKYHKICSEHFVLSDFQYAHAEKRRLKRHAVPSIFLKTETLKDSTFKEDRIKVKKEYRFSEDKQRNEEFSISYSDEDTDSALEEDVNYTTDERKYTSEKTQTSAQVTPSPAVTSATSRAMSSTSPSYEFETLKVSSTGEFIKHVELNRPSKLNAMNTAFWQDMIDCFTRLSHDPDCRVIILSGAGKMFTAGLDFKDAEALEIPMMDKDPGYKAFAMNRHLQHLQNSFTVVEKCNKPVIAAIHNGCIGGGIDLTCCCDMRYCTEDAWFTIKEVDLGLAADLGTLSRLPKITGNDSLCRELVYTGRKFDAKEAQTLGFVSRVFPNKATMMAACEVIAAGIASKSPVAVQGSKHLMVYSRDHTVQEGLDYTVVWNSAMLQSEDCKKAMMAMMSKEKPSFSKL